MKPRQLIIVHGPPEASQDLAECCRAFGGKDIKVYMPKLHETVDATSETHIYQVSVLAFKEQVLRGEIIGGFQPQLHIRRALGGVRGVQCFRYIRITAGGTLASVETKICHVVPVCSRS